MHVCCRIYRHICIRVLAQKSPLRSFQCDLGLQTNSNKKTTLIRLCFIQAWPIDNVFPLCGSDQFVHLTLTIVRTVIMIELLKIFW